MGFNVCLLKMVGRFTGHLKMFLSSFVVHFDIRVWVGSGAEEVLSAGALEAQLVAPPLDCLDTSIGRPVGHLRVVVCLHLIILVCVYKSDNQTVGLWNVDSIWPV